MNSKQVVAAWPVRMAVVLFALGSLLAVGSPAKAAQPERCTWDETDVDTPLVKVMETNGTYTVCVFSVVGETRITVSKRSTETWVSLGEESGTIRVGVGACVPTAVVFEETCAYDPRIDWYQGVSTSTATTTGAGSNTTVFPCLSTYTPDYFDVGTVCAGVGNAASANVSPDRTATARVMPGVCFSQSGPTWGYHCYYVQAWTHVDGRGTVPVFSHVVAVCDYGPNYYPPCLVYQERRV
jgi:hypothetical protein